MRLRLDHGNAVIVGRRSDDSLYDRALATYDAEDAFDHAAAVGFIRIFGLPLQDEAARHGAVGAHHGAAWSWTDPLLPSLPVSIAICNPGAGARRLRRRRGRSARDGTGMRRLLRAGVGACPEPASFAVRGTMTR